MDKLNSEKFKENLLRLVRMDYGFELYNYNENMIRFSFYYLNSTYNAFCTTLTDSNNPSINWQYATPNKKAERLVKEIVSYIWVYYRLRKSYDWIEKEVNFYKVLSDTVFKAKFSTKTNLHTWNAD